MNQINPASLMICLAVRRSKNPYKIDPSHKETDANMAVTYVDSSGKTTPPADNESHQVGMTESLDVGASKGEGKKAHVCTTPCGGNTVGADPVSDPDRMTISPNAVVVLDKRFTIDGHPAKVYDPGTRTLKDFIHQYTDWKTGTTLTYGDDKK